MQRGLSDSSTVSRPQQLMLRSSLCRSHVLPVLGKVTTRQTGTTKQAAATAKGAKTVTSKSTVSGNRSVKGGNTSVKGTSKAPAVKQQQQQEPRRGSRFYLNITGFPFPLAPFFERKTVRNEVCIGQCGMAHRHYMTFVMLLAQHLHLTWQQPQTFRAAYQL